jgi:hypothetical protein
MRKFLHFILKIFDDKLLGQPSGALVSIPEKNVGFYLGVREIYRCSLRNFVIATPQVNLCGFLPRKRIRRS